MTGIIIPSAEKKSDNVPLVTDMEIDPSSQAKDLEAGNVGNDRPVKSKFLVLRVINERVYSTWALIYVLLMSLLIIFMMLYGEYIYRAISNAFSDENDSYYGTEIIGFNDKSFLPLQDTDRGINSDYEVNELSDMDFQKLESFALNMEKMNDQMMNPEDIISHFKEEFEMDLKEDSYEKLSPVLPLTSAARFIHDFSANVTGIVDVEGKQCFVMPLNHNALLPPKSLYDLLFKMSSGYYSVDTSNVMHNMRVVKPAIKDLTEYGVYIAKDCAGYPTYKLESIVSEGV